MRPLRPPYDAIAACRRGGPGTGRVRIALSADRIEGVADPVDADALEASVDAAMWWPAYVPYTRADAG